MTWDIIIGGEQTDDVAASLARFGAKDFSKVQVCRNLDAFGSPSLVSLFSL